MTNAHSEWLLSAKIQVVNGPTHMVVPIPITL